MLIVFTLLYLGTATACDVIPAAKTKPVPCVLATLPDTLLTNIT